MLLKSIKPTFPHKLYKAKKVKISNQNSANHVKLRNDQSILRYTKR